MNRVGFIASLVVVLHVLSCRIPILPGVGVSVWGLVLAGEIAIAVALAVYLICRGNVWRLSWRGDAAVAQ